MRRARRSAWDLRTCLLTYSLTHLLTYYSLTTHLLTHRIKAIERACGQHAVAKMKLFATILALEGYVDLAEY